MEYRILQKKLFFLHPLTNLPDNTLAKKVLSIQTKMNLPGIAQECAEFLAWNGLHDMSLYSKQQFKRLVKVKIFELNKCKLLKTIKDKNYKKVNLVSLEKEAFEMKAYFKEMNVNDSRVRVKIAKQMLPTIKTNFQYDMKFTSDCWVARMGIIINMILKSMCLLVKP